MGPGHHKRPDYRQPVRAPAVRADIHILHCLLSWTYCYKLPLVNHASVDYNDPHYIAGGPLGKHPAVTSDASFYPEATPIVYPNPYNPESDGNIKFRGHSARLHQNSIHLSAEMVKVINSTLIRAEWDGQGHPQRQPGLCRIHWIGAFIKTSPRPGWRSKICREKGVPLGVGLCAGPKPHRAAT